MVTHALGISLLAALAALVLAAVAEHFHAKRVARIARLAFGPAGKPAPWARAAPVARIAGLGFARDPYCVSKALINALAAVWARDFPRRTAVSVSPGWVQTDMGGPGALLPLAEGVSRVVAAVTQPVRSGAFYQEGQPSER